MSAEQRFFNRELSWIEFNRRVLGEAQDPSVPLLERLKFVAIVMSNFDEFFMVRVATVRRQVIQGQAGNCPTGMSPAEQLAEMMDRYRGMSAETYDLLHQELLPSLSEAGITIRSVSELSPGQLRHARDYYQTELAPLLTPVRVAANERLQQVENNRLAIAFLLSPDGEVLTTEIEAGADGSAGPDAGQPRIAVVPLPGNTSRFIPVPCAVGTQCFALADDCIASFGADLFPGQEILDRAVFRLTRDADLGVDEDRDDDFVEAMGQVLMARENGDVVRLVLSPCETTLRDGLVAAAEVDESRLFEHPGPLDLKSLMKLSGLPGFDSLRYASWEAAPGLDADDGESMFPLIAARDHLLYHPYHSFAPVVRLLREAAADPDVLAIKMTLYRTSTDSPVIAALEAAASAGKQVTAVVELKARFDEARNIGWAQRLEHAGVIVVYGIARLKIHAKALLIVRKEPNGIRRYLHLGTGNYNDTTARLYTDFGLLTSDERLGYDLSLVFNALTGYSSVPRLTRLVMAPTQLKSRILQMIEREASRAKNEEPGIIIGKMNALADVDVIRALYSASQAGVRIRLNVRGICMLVPGVKGLSENIQVVSVIDRYLEHARAFYFRNGGTDELYLSSADWMPRNLERRVELMFPVGDPAMRRRILRFMELSLDDERKGHLLRTDGSFRKRKHAADDPGSQYRSWRQVQDSAQQRYEENPEFTVRRSPTDA